MRGEEKRMVSVSAGWAWQYLDMGEIQLSLCFGEEAAFLDGPHLDEWSILRLHAFNLGPVSIEGHWFHCKDGHTFGYTRGAGAPRHPGPCAYCRSPYIGRGCAG